MKRTKALILDEGKKNGAKRLVSYSVDYNENCLLTLFETEEHDGHVYIPSKNISFDKYQMLKLYYFIKELIQEETK